VLGLVGTLMVLGGIEVTQLGFTVGCPGLPASTGCGTGSGEDVVAVALIVLGIALVAASLLWRADRRPEG
jgi:hypothetical protein